MGLFNTTKNSENVAYTEEFENHYFTLSTESLIGFEDRFEIVDAVYVQGNYLEDLKQLCFKNGCDGVLGVRVAAYQQYDGGFSGSGRYVPVMLYYGTAVKLREKQ